MLEARLALLFARRQRHPALNAVQARAPPALFGSRALGMNDAPPRDHPVDVAGADRLGETEVITVYDLAFEEVSHRGERYVWVRPNVHSLAVGEFRGAHVVEKDEGPDQTSLGRRQDAPYSQRVQVARASADYQLDRRRIGFAYRRVRARATDS